MTGLFDMQPPVAPQGGINYPQRNDAFMFPPLQTNQPSSPQGAEVDAINAQQQQVQKQNFPWHPIVDQYMKMFLGVDQ